jgi:hypothetical protein
MTESDPEGTLTAEFEGTGADGETAARAAELAAAFCADYDDLTAEDVVEAVRAVDAYEGFDRRYNCAVGDLAAGLEDCTDSRDYRLAGFGTLAADPEQGA